MQDPELTDKSILSIQGTPAQFSFLEGIVIIGITEEQLHNYGAFFNEFYGRISQKYNSNITRNASTMLKGAAFAISTKSHNKEWKEHCASSLREIGHQWKAYQGLIADFTAIYCNNKHFEENDKSILCDFMKSYNYFSAIAHHDAQGISASIRNFTDNQDLKTEECMTEDVFLNQVKRYFELLAQIVEIPKRYNDNR